MITELCNKIFNEMFFGIIVFGLLVYLWLKLTGKE